MNIYVSLTTEELDESGFKTKAELQEYVISALDSAPGELEGFNVTVIFHGPTFQANS